MSTGIGFLTRLGVQTSGYRPKVPATDLSLGAVNGLSYILWSYSFASMIFTGALAAYLPLAVVVLLVSSTILAVVVSLTSEVPGNVAGFTEQAVAILASVALLLNARYHEFASPAAAAATMFAIMGLVTVLFGLCLHLSARLNLGVVVQFMPIPVVCGFLAGTGWLCFAAAITTTTDVEVVPGRLAQLAAPDLLWRWLPALLAALAITVLLRVKHHVLTLPLALLACFGGFHAFAHWRGWSLAALRDGGWVFKLESTGAAKGLAELDFAGVNFGFIATVLPEIATIVLLCLLSTSFALSAIDLGLGATLNLPHELRSHRTANLASGLGLGLPGVTDVSASVLFHNLGATSRVPGLLTGALCLVAAVVGGRFVQYLPKFLVATVVFVAAIHLVHVWLLKACRQMSRGDVLTVWLILGVIVMVGFIPGIVLGIVLTSLLFIARYSKIEIVSSSFSLDQVASSVERPARDRALILTAGSAAEVFNLRGFLFFGSATMFFERIKARVRQDTSQSYFIFNFRRVTGLDSTTAQIFVRLANLLAARRITPVFCGLNQAVAGAFRLAQADASTQALILDDLDQAMALVEERLLAEQRPEAAPPGIRDVLTEILGAPEKAERLLGIMQRRTLAKGEHLFRQGDPGTSLYVIESGAVEVRLEGAGGAVTRLREFRSGTVLGEMAAYGGGAARSASAVALEPGVFYELEPARTRELGERAPEYELILHEFVARLVSARLQFMNRRAEADI